MLLKLLLAPIWLFFVLLQAFYWTYLWQLKEYRFDRLRSATLEQGWRFLVPLHFYRPVFSTKAVMVAFAGIVCSTVMATFSPLLWILTPFWISFFVLILAVPTLGYKRYIFRKASKKLKSFLDLKVIGVTGSYGKSSTKELIAGVLSAKYKTAKTPKNNNTLVGVCRAVLSLKKDTQFFIVEIGAYKKGEIRKICQLVRPGIGVITGLCPQHLALFGSMENLVAAKLELAEAIGKKGTMFLNRDDTLLKKYVGEIRAQIIWYSSGADYAVANLAGAAKVGEHFAVPKNKISQALKNIPFGIDTVTAKNGLKILNDCYNSNPIGFEYALEQLSKANRKNKILITRGIIELGEESAKIHKGLGQKAGKVADLVIVTKREFAGYLGGRLVSDPKDVAKIVKQFPPQETAVLLEGRLNKWLIQSLHN
ncbi:MAG: Mur ligase family protein [bacterium]